MRECFLHTYRCRLTFAKQPMNSLLHKTGCTFAATARAAHLAVLLCSVLTAPAMATDIPIGDAANYAVLYSGQGSGTQLSISNVTINGNIGVGGTASVADSGPSSLGGRVDFSAANTGQFHNTNGGNVGPTKVNYSQSNVTADLSLLRTLSDNLGGVAGTSVSLLNAATQTINAASGQLYTSQGVTYRVFNISSVQDQNGQILTINGDGSGAPVVFNFQGSANLQGAINLAGLTDDQVLWNFTGGSNGSSGPTLSLNNNASSHPAQYWHGTLLDPNGAVSLVNANLDGRVFGGGIYNMQIVSGDTINAPPSHQIPEPATPFLLLAGTILMWLARRAPGKRR